LRLDVVGEAVSLASEQTAALRLETPVAAVTSRTVQAYFTALLAQARGWRLESAAPEPGRFRLSSVESAS
jgi:hypothetical protein